VRRWLLLVASLAALIGFTGAPAEAPARCGGSGSGVPVVRERGDRLVEGPVGRPPRA